MPGTIQVTVLEFKGFSSTSKPSAKSLKVSMGKRQFQTWDKGDFSFPITKLGEDLVVCLLDAGGNEIAHQDIRLMQIIEKGNYDEVFTINGGGHVHMKLQFVLSEEERHRIRLMRETAVKKKLETNPNIKLRILQASSSMETSTGNDQKISDEVKPIVEGSQAGSSLASATSSAKLLKTAIPVKKFSVEDATDGSQIAPSSPTKLEIKSESPKIQETVPDHESIRIDNVRLDIKEGPPLSKTSRSPTSDNNNIVASKLHEEDQTRSNVRKMISALENSKIQEAKSMKKVSSVPAHLNKLRKATVLSEDQESKPDKSCTYHAAETVSERADIVPSDHGSSDQAQKELSSNETPSGNDLQKLEMRQSTSEAATSSGRMAEETTHELSSSSIDSAEPSLVQGSVSRRERGTGLESSNMIMASNKEPTLEYYNEECSSGGMWIFPDNTRPLCITTAGHQNETKAHQVDNVSSRLLDKSEIAFKTEKKEKSVDEVGSGRSPNGSSDGRVGQIIKIAIIVGFGVLVILTRQKEPRKKRTEENDNLFRVPKYI